MRWKPRPATDHLERLAESTLSGALPQQPQTLRAWVALRWHLPGRWGPFPMQNRCEVRQAILPVAVSPPWPALLMPLLPRLSHELERSPVQPDAISACGRHVSGMMPQTQRQGRRIAAPGACSTGRSTGRAHRRGAHRGTPRGRRAPLRRRGAPRHHGGRRPRGVLPARGRSEPVLGYGNRTVPRLPCLVLLLLQRLLVLALGGTKSRSTLQRAGCSGGRLCAGGRSRHGRSAPDA